jgi:NADH:ubiquinone oxidoreductase subunit D
MSRRSTILQEELIMPTLQDGTEITGPRAGDILRRYSMRYTELAAAIELAEHLVGQAAGAQLQHDAALAVLAAERQAAETATATAKQAATDAEAHAVSRKQFLAAEQTRGQQQVDALLAEKTTLQRDVDALKAEFSALKAKFGA